MPENQRRRVTQENLLNMHRDGFYGKFGSGGNVEVSYIQSVMDFDFLQEITLIEDIKGSDQWDVRDLFQRNVDKHRVDNEIIPFLKDESSTKFFAPLVLVLLPMKDSKVDNDLSEINSVKEGEGSESIVKHKIGEFIEFEEFTENPAWSKVKWNRQEIKLVAVDGQHRVTALKAILNDDKHDPLVENMKIPVLIVGFSKSNTDTTINHNPLLLDEVRKTFVYINNKSQKINESRAILLDNEDINSIAVQEVIQVAHDNDKESQETFSGLPLAVFDWRGEERNGLSISGPASLYSVRDLKDWFYHYLLGDKNNRNVISSQIIPRLDLDHVETRIHPDQIVGLNHENSQIARNQFSNYLLPSIIYVLENIEPIKKYIADIREVQKKTNEETTAYGRFAYKWICFGKSQTPSQIDIKEVEAAYEKLCRDLINLKDSVPSLLLKDIGIRAIWSSYSMLYDLKTKLSERPDWMEFSKWYVDLVNQVINDGWFIGLEETPSLKADQKRKLTHIVYTSDAIVNYRPERAPKAFGAFLMMLILQKNNDMELKNVGWDEVKDDLASTVKAGYTKETRNEMITEGYVGNALDQKLEREKRVEEKILKWEKNMSSFFEVI